MLGRLTNINTQARRLPASDVKDPQPNSTGSQGFVAAIVSADDDKLDTELEEAIVFRP
jgi:hypothetical protein